MSTDYYTVTGNPVNLSFGASALIRTEFTSIETGFSLLPGLTGNASKMVAVKSDETGLEAVTGATALTNMGITATVAELNYVDGVTSALQPQLDGLATLIGVGTGGITPTSRNGVIGDGSDWLSLPVSTLDYAAGGGSADAYTMTLSPVPAAYVTGAKYRFKASFTNTTTSPTLNVNSLGAKSIKKFGSVDVEGGDIESGNIVECVYDGTNMQWTGGLPVTNDIISYGVAGGSASAQTLTPSPPLTAYKDGMIVSFSPVANSTGATTLDISGLGAKSIKKRTGLGLGRVDIAASDISINRTVIVVYCGSLDEFLLISPTVVMSKLDTRTPATGALFVGNGSGWDTTTSMTSATDTNVSGHVQRFYNSTNYASGYQALYSLTSGTNDTAIGTGAASGVTTEFGLVAIGNDCATSGASDTVAIGYLCMNTATSAEAVAVGKEALKVSTGANNIAIGYKSCLALTTGYSSVAIGHEAAKAATTSFRNIAIGERAYTGLVAGSNENVAVGHTAAFAATSLSYCVTVGATATHASGTTYGVSVGHGASSSSSSVAIGASASATGTNTICIGTSVSSSTSNAAVLGDSSITATTLRGSVTLGTLPAILAEYTVAGVPTASSYDNGVIIVSDEVGGRTLATSDGTNWRRVSDGAVVS